MAMVDKMEVNLTGVKQNKSVWLVKVRAPALPFWLVATGPLNACVRGSRAKVRVEPVPFGQCQIVSRQVPKYLSVQWEKAAEKGDVGKISIGKQVGQCVHAPKFFVLT